MKQLAGRAWVFGDDLNTDLMAPGPYFKLSMEEMAKHCLEAVNPDFACQVQSGDIVVAGRNFGVGSAREQAVLALTHLGVGAVLAVSFGRIFYRNALNFGLPALIWPDAGTVLPGDRLHVDPVMGRIENERSGALHTVPGIPAHLMAMVEAGGLMPWLKVRLNKESA